MLPGVFLNLCLFFRWGNSTVICTFLTFSVISFRARRLWHSANAAAEKQPKSDENYAQIHSNRSQNRPKSMKVVPRNAPKVILEASRFQVTKKAPPSLRNGCHLSATWAILGVIWRLAGRQWVPKIEHFGVRLRQNLKKCFPE